MAESPGDTVRLTDDVSAEDRRTEAAPSGESIRAALAGAEGSVQRAARALGLKSRFVLYRLMKKHGVEALSSGETDVAE